MDKLLQQFKDFESHAIEEQQSQKRCITEKLQHLPFVIDPALLKWASPSIDIPRLSLLCHYARLRPPIYETELIQRMSAHLKNAQQVQTANTGLFGDLIASIQHEQQEFQRKLQLHLTLFNCSQLNYPEVLDCYEPAAPIPPHFEGFSHLREEQVVLPEHTLIDHEGLFNPLTPRITALLELDDGVYLSGGWDGQLILFTKGGPLQTIAAHMAPITQLLQLHGVVASRDLFGSLRIWLYEGKLVPHRETALMSEYHPLSMVWYQHFLLSHFEDGTLIVLDLLHGQQQYKLRECTKSTMLAREGQVYIATVDDQVSVTIFDMGIRKVVEEIRVPLHKAVSSLEFDGDTLIEHGNSSARVLQLRPHVTVSKQKYGSRFPDLATIRQHISTTHSHGTMIVVNLPKLTLRQKSQEDVTLDLRLDTIQGCLFGPHSIMIYGDGEVPLHVFSEKGHELQGQIKQELTSHIQFEQSQELAQVTQDQPKQDDQAPQPTDLIGTDEAHSQHQNPQL